MIQVTYNLERDDLICSICYDTVSTPLIQCQNANHFVCFGCIMKCKRSCPQCRTSKVFHNKQLEKHIKDQMVNCSYEGCQKMLFQWAVQEHIEMCPYKQYKCKFCDEFISMQSLNKHIKTTCTVNWMEQTKDDHSASLALAPYHTSSARGYYFELKEIKKSFVVLYFQYVLIFLRQDSKWLVTVLNHKKETKNIEITYWLPKISDKFDVFSTLQIQPTYSLDQVEQLPEIPIEAVDIEFEILTEDNDSDGADNFFARLLQPVLEN